MFCLTKTSKRVQEADKIQSLEEEVEPDSLQREKNESKSTCGILCADPLLIFTALRESQVGNDTTNKW